MLSTHRSHPTEDDQPLLSCRYASRFVDRPVPRDMLPLEGMPSDVAYQLVHDELNLDGNPALNLASFVCSWMEPEADKLMLETLNKNYIDADEYPQSTEIQTRCVSMLARLWHAPGPDTVDSPAVGTATVGSSEAIHLAGLALKWRWRARRLAEGKPTDRPNLVMSQGVQVCWEKFARYFDVEPRYVPLEIGRYVLDVDAAVEMVDENTIGVVAILGTTYTGEYEPVKELCEALTGLNERTGWDVGIHVDGASGGFVAPFLTPELHWDFRLPLVRSINSSGHKYGLVYPGVGWVVWRTAADLPEDLVFHVNYLGGDQPSFTLNFSRGAGQIIAQYFNFLRLGRSGYSEVMHALQHTARYLTEALLATGHFDVLSQPDALPLVCVALKGPRSYSVFDLSDKLRERGWIVPAYTLAANAESVAVLRIVVREGLSRDMAQSLTEHIDSAVQYFDRAGAAAAVAHRHKRKTKGVC
jgi:glutamate decarboxylase